eukprot:Skav209674  [mRNA]  locus=scaffold1603:30998:32344:- [translate_table: standard]
MKYVQGALALGFSLEASGTTHDRVLLHTSDLPEESLQLLGQFWTLKEVPYIISAGDLHVDSDKVRFREVFTKLHVFNPDAVPFDKVVFLDLDMIVLRNIDELFDLRTPAGMSTFKHQDATGARNQTQPPHGQRLDPRKCYVNAGTMVTAPSKELFQLLEADVTEPDPQWHLPAWSPEQKYLSRVMAGEWSHVSQLYNFEVQVHSGVPISNNWCTAEANDVAVAHFSGHVKAWDKGPDQDLPILASDFSKLEFGQLPLNVQKRAQARCSILHAEWLKMYAMAMKRCHIASPSNGSLSLSEASEFMPGEDVMVEERTEEGPLRYRATVLRCHPETGDFWLWRPSLSEGLGSCTRPPSDARISPALPTEDAFDLGSQAIAWFGEGHELGLVVALCGEERCLRFRDHSAWLPVGLLKEVHNQVDLQCGHCYLSGLNGCFKDGIWACRSCSNG